VELRELAFLGSRMIALYWAVRAFQAAPALAHLLAPQQHIAVSILWPELAVPALWAVLAAGLWFFSDRVANLVAGQHPARRYAKASREELRYLGFLTLGLMIAADGLGALLKGLLEGRIMLHPAQTGIEALTTLMVDLLRVLIGLWLILGAAGLVSGLGLFSGRSGTQLPGTRGGDDGSAAALLRELLARGGSASLNRLGDLALALRSEAEGVALRVVRSSIEAVIASVERRRPDFSAAAAPDGAVTIAFSDMEGFSAMTERLGDRKAHAVIQAHNAIVRKALQAHGGQEVELQGDGFLLAFPAPQQALRCAAAIQRACARHSARRGAEPIRVRIGLHSGTPIKEGDRFFGITVILAARIAGQAGGGEVLVSAAVHEQVRDDAGFAFGDNREAELKGLAGTHLMYPLRWERAA
jgi:class 3 adenylate cyclase